MTEEDIEPTGQQREGKITAVATIAALFLVPAVYCIVDDLGWLGALHEEDKVENAKVT